MQLVETEKEYLLKRLRDFCEYAKATRKFHDLDLYEKLIKYIENVPVAE
jgi:hypothetical protein